MVVQLHNREVAVKRCGRFIITQKSCAKFLVALATRRAQFRTLKYVTQVVQVKFFLWSYYWCCINLIRQGWLVSHLTQSSHGNSI